MLLIFTPFCQIPLGVGSSIGGEGTRPGEQGAMSSPPGAVQLTKPCHRVLRGHRLFNYYLDSQGQSSGPENRPPLLACLDNGGIEELPRLRFQKPNNERKPNSSLGLTATGVWRLQEDTTWANPSFQDGRSHQHPPAWGGVQSPV